MNYCQNLPIFDPIQDVTTEFTEVKPELIQFPREKLLAMRYHTVSDGYSFNPMDRIYFACDTQRPTQHTHIDATFICVLMKINSDMKMSRERCVWFVGKIL